MNILLLEAGGSHIECMYSLIHILYKNNERVFVACNKKLVSSLKEPSKLAGLLELPDDITKKQHFLLSLKIRKYIRQQKIEAIVINTTEISFIRDLLFLLPKLNYTGIIHSAKRLEKSFTFTKLISRKIRKFFVLGDYLLSELNPHPVFRVASFYPVYFPEVKKRFVKKDANEIWITIPGKAEQSRKDYLGLLQAIEKNKLDPDIKFIFLGENKLNQPMLAQLNDSDKLKQHVITFDNYIDYDEFHSYIQQSDYILPLLKTSNDDFFGNNRISGSFNLGLGYKLPFLLPESYNVNIDLKPYSIYYSDLDDLLYQIQQLQSDPRNVLKIKKEFNSGRFNNIDDVLQDAYKFILS